jgi:endogenous inhibitor of DNA gyrase (YacG/DUF329 family)
VSARGRHAPAAGKGAKGQAKRPKCPICGKPQVEAFRPFCSKHCADIDLGRWLDGRYAVPGEPLAKDEIETDNDR